MLFKKIKTMRKKLNLTEDIEDSIKNSNVAKVLVFGKVLRICKESVAIGSGSFLIRKRLEEAKFKNISKKDFSNFVTFERRPRI